MSNKPTWTVQNPTTRAIVEEEIPQEYIDSVNDKQQEIIDKVKRWTAERVDNLNRCYWRLEDDLIFTEYNDTVARKQAIGYQIDTTALLTAFDNLHCLTDEQLAERQAVIKDCIEQLKNASVMLQGTLGERYRNDLNNVAKHADGYTVSHIRKTSNDFIPFL